MNDIKYVPETIKRFLAADELTKDSRSSVFLSFLDEIRLEDDITLRLCISEIVSAIRECKGIADDSVAHVGSDSKKNSGHKLEQFRITSTLLENIKYHMQIIDMLREDYVWENLNIGHWKTVSLGWRRAHYFLSFLKVIFMLIALDSPLRDVIRECDLGILMGEPLLNNVLHRVSEEISQAIQETEKINSQYENECHDNVSDNEEIQLRLQSKFRFQIERYMNPPIEYFLKWMKKCSPLLMSHCIEHWPARQKWDINYIKKVAGFRTVPVEIGSKYTSNDWTQKLMTIDEFIERYINVKAPEVGYIAQHRLFEQIPELQKDIKVPDLCLLGKTDEVEVNAWFGPSNTISPTHYDPKHNILVQIFGTKIIRLYPPTESNALRPFPSSSILFNTSQLDLDTIDFKDCPDLLKAKYCEFLLKPGEAIYIPPKWWHYVKSLTPCFSVSYWFE